MISLWYFEMIDMLHKFIMTSMLGFVPNDVQLPFALSVNIAYTIIILFVKPYKRKGDGKNINLILEYEQIE